MAQYLPDWLRSPPPVERGLLPVQLHRIWVHGNCQGISLGYLLLNLICATEQFTVGFFFVVNNTGGSDFFVETPLTPGDWLNFAQLALIWALQLLLFGLCLWFPSGDHTGHKLGALIAYVLFTLIPIVPLFIDALNPEIFGHRGSSDRNWAEALYSGGHLLFVNPIATILAIVAFFYQARAIRALPTQDLQAISLLGLLAQGIVFAVVAISWTLRVTFLDLSLGDIIVHGGWFSWYELVGWAAVDNAAFALVQILLFHVARKHERVEMSDAEREPLLGAARE